MKTKEKPAENNLFGSLAKAMQHHGTAQGSGEHKRHPATSGYKQTLSPRKRRHV